MIRLISILLKKELYSFFTAPSSYLFMAIFLFLISWTFFNQLLSSQNGAIISLNSSLILPLFGNMNFILLFLMPLITMRFLAEERRDQTLDLLLLSSLTPLQIILGKATALAVILLFMMVLTLMFPLILMVWGYSEWSFLFSCYLGTFLNGLSYGVIGLFFSGLTKTPLLSAVLSFFFSLLLLLLAQSASVVSNYMLAQFIGNFSIVTHFYPFSQGIIATKDLFYFVSFIGFFIYLTHLSLKKRS